MKKIALHCLILLAIFNSCKEDPTDPCIGTKPTSAEFEVYTIHNSGWQEYEKKFVSDTFGLNSQLIFSALNKGYESYEWIFGTDPKHRYGAEVSLDFLLNQDEQIKVTLISKNKPNIKCHPNDDGIDTISKYIYFRDGTKSAIFGIYRGHLTSNPDNEFEVKIIYGLPLPPNFKEISRITGIAIPGNTPPKSFCDTATETGVGCNYAIFIEGNSCGSSPYGWAVLNQKTNEIRIDYKIRYPWPTSGDIKFQNRTFIGKKIK